MKVHWDDVEDLAIAYRAKAALHRLMHAGVLASEAVRQGLGHPNPDVRVGCCQVLDHFLDEEAVPALIENLTHEDGRVRQWAMHALACDRCKEGACRPGEDDSVPIAIRMLKSDPEALVRDQAIRLLFPLIHSRLDIREAIESAKDDPDPRVRKTASLRAPGGVMFLRSSPHREDRRRLRTSSARARLSR